LDNKTSSFYEKSNGGTRENIANGKIEKKVSKEPSLFFATEESRAKFSKFSQFSKLSKTSQISMKSDSLLSSKLDNISKSSLNSIKSDADAPSSSHYSQFSVSTSVINELNSKENSKISIDSKKSNKSKISKNSKLTSKCNFSNEKKALPKIVRILIIHYFKKLMIEM